MPGWLLRAGQTAKAYPAIRLDEVRIQPSAPPETPPPRLRPEDPDQLEALLAAWMPVDEAASLSPMPVPEPAPSPGLDALASAQDPLASRRDPEAWRPRQEILSIQNRLFADEVIALPRRLIPDVSRVDVAGDIVLPVETLDAESHETGDGVPGPGGTGWSGQLSGIGPLAPPEQTLPTEDPALALPAIQPPTEMFDEAPESIAEAEPVEDLLSLAVSAYRDASDHALYFELQIQRKGDSVLPVLPRDVLLIQDCSESMTPWKLAECRRGLRSWLETLTPEDRLEIVGFRDVVEPAFGGWRPVDESTRREAIAFIDGMRAEGDTDVFGSLQAALAIPRSVRRPTLAVLITDGRPTAGVTGSSEIIDRITSQNQGELSMFAVGAGKRVNSFFLDLLSYRNRGGSVVLAQDEDIDLAIEDLARQIRRPVLTGLSYQFAGLSNDEIYPRTLTHLYLDRPLVLHGRAADGVNTMVFRIVGRSGEQLYDMVYQVDLADAAPGTSDVRTRWARQKAYDLIGTYIQEPSDGLLEEIRSLARAYGMILPYGFSDSVPR
ncbi:MAG: VWA domain-containing protein [Verrucomicrobia bacterium]|nr:VWA domain-containing protein [Verrucomicrobiota bacterium]